MNRIGVLDSGVGGFTVVRPLLEKFPDVSITYVADTAHVPYSNKSPEQLGLIVRKILRFFLMENVDGVLFACNTSSALVLPVVQSRSFVPFFGVIEPGVRGALGATKGGGIGVAANAVTARSGIFSRKIHEASPGLPVIEQACGELVSFVERGELDSGEVLQAVRACCSPFAGKVDTLIFGCTHFPFLKEAFRRELPGAALIDPAEILLDEIAPRLQNAGSSRGKPVRHKLFATGASSHVNAWAEKVLGWKIKAVPLDLEPLEPWEPAMTENRC